MLGYVLYGLHIAFQRIAAPIRQRRAIRALRQVSDAKDACRMARVRGDTRAQHEAESRLLAARNEQLRAELALVASRYPRPR